MEETLQWGIIGGAKIAMEAFLPALHRAPEGDIRAVASRSGSSEQFEDVPVFYGTYEELLDDELIDAVYIALPNALHAEWARKAMEKGKHVLLEKPAGVTSDEVRQMKETAEQYQVVLMEAFMHQFHKQHDVVKKVLQSNKLGDWKLFRAHFSFQIQDDTNIRLNKELGGGALYDIGCYGIHTMNQLLGWKPEKVTTRGKTRGNGGVDLMAVALFEDGSGRIGEVLASFDLPASNRYEIICENGSIQVEDAYRPDKSANGCGTVIVKDKSGQVVSSVHVKDDAYKNEIDHFHQCIRESVQPDYTMENSKDVNVLVESAYQALRTQKKSNIRY
ncbi:Gfo/Idh/MocA family protein [Salibacterium qingdaonense]|uniref:Predicted dehydrogenase n=1 Tax=Salibacterium qingdaonense TaxID=266892 RepID=A0A1I4PWE3_9BACI|nr:Gfo/Idh/MocA family oxidoreductase [Salibacterium qingdaonense]SFM32118.1 Predicted dehydrogenase [Salibacterium qingdaonense]